MARAVDAPASQSCPRARRGCRAAAPAARAAAPAGDRSRRPGKTGAASRRPAGPASPGNSWRATAPTRSSSPSSCRCRATRRAGRAGRQSASALRVDVPSSSIAAVKLARPGLSGGFESLPPRNTRLAATIGTSCFSLRISVSPFGSVAVVGVAQLQRLRGPGLRLRVAPRLVDVDRRTVASLAVDAAGVGGCGPTAAPACPAPRTRRRGRWA